LKIVLLSLCTAAILMGATGDSQSVLSEVSKLRQKYEECRASQNDIKGIDPKVLADCRDENKKIVIEIAQKNGVIKSLEQTMLVRDRAYRETNARNKNLVAQLHTDQVSRQEREMLKKALVDVKGELALAQKELRGGSSSLVKVREELNTAKATLAKVQSQPSQVQTVKKVVTKVVESTEKVQSLQAQLHAANLVIEQLRSAPAKPSAQQPQVIYKDRIVTQEKIVYKDRPVEKIVTKTVESTEKIQALTRDLANAQAMIAKLKKDSSQVVYKDRIVKQEKVVYKDRPIEKVVEKVVYRDRPIEKEKIVEKIVYKDRPVEKVVTKTVIVEKAIIDENTRRKMDKLALDLEREKTLNKKLTDDLAKAPVKRIVATALPSLPSTAPKPLSTVKTVVAHAVKKVQPVEEAVVKSTKKSSGVYRMASEAPIYSSPNGKVIDTWEARRSFTGSGASNGWIHITGYFVNRVFQGTGEGEDLWVKESDAIRR